MTRCERCGGTVTVLNEYEGHRLACVMCGRDADTAALEAKRQKLRAVLEAEAAAFAERAA